MKINFNQVIKDFDGKPIETEIPDPDDEKKTKRVQLTLKKVCIDAFHFERIDPSTRQSVVTGEQRFDRFRLGMLISKNKNGVVELISTDITTIKTAVGDAWPSPEIVGRAWEALEQKSEEETTDADKA